MDTGTHTHTHTQICYSTYPWPSILSHLLETFSVHNSLLNTLLHMYTGIHNNNKFHLNGNIHQQKFTEMLAKEIERAYKLLPLYFLKHNCSPTITLISSSLQIIFRKLLLSRFSKKYIYPLCAQIQTNIRIAMFDLYYACYHSNIS